MPDPLKKLRETKAQLLQKAAEVDRDLRELERITAKYNLVISDSAAEQVVKSAKNGARRPNEPDPNSLTRRCQDGAEAIIRERGFPVRLSDLHAELGKRGVYVTGKKPRTALSAFLSHSKNVYSIPNVGWWVRGLSLPDELKRMGFRAETSLRA